MPDVNMQVFEEVQRNQLVTEIDIQTQVALDDYQVQLSDIANPTSSQDNVIISGGEFLTHWNESIEFDTWVKISMEVAGKRILMLRGNSIVSSISNGDNTHEFFDDFNTGSVPDTSKWENPSANNMIVSSGELDTNGVGNYNPTIYGKTDFGAGHAMRIKFKNVIDADNTWFGFVDSTTGYTGINDGAIIFHHISADWFGRYYIGGSETTDSSIWAEDTNVYHIYDIEWLSNSLDYKKDGVSEWNPTATLVGSDLHVAIEGYTSNSDSRVDWVFVRKLDATEPTLAVDDEEQNIAVALKSLGRAG